MMMMKQTNVKQKDKKRILNVTYTRIRAELNTNVLPARPAPPRSMSPINAKRERYTFFSFLVGTTNKL